MSLPRGTEYDCARQEFLSLYPNRHQSILKPKGCKTWVTLSRHATLTDDNIWSAVAAKDETFWGCRWSDRARFAVLDLDVEGQYHNDIGLARLKHTLASVGITSPLLYQSSPSSGWHMYLPWTEWVESQEVFQTLKHWLQKESFDVRKGDLEIFPSNNGLRLPLQRGFAWLEEHGNIETRREDLTQDDAVARFLQDLDVNAHSWQLVKQRIEARIRDLEAAAVNTPFLEPKNPKEDDDFAAFFTTAGLIPEVFEHGRQYWAQGLTGPNQRHHATLCLGHYLWYGDEFAGVQALPGIRNAGRRAEVIEDWIRTHHNGHSKSVLKGDWNEVLGDIRRACHWTSPEGTERAYESYSLTDRCIDRLVGLTKQTGKVWTPTYLEKGNIGREETARQKIRQALTELVNSGRRVTVRGLQRISGCKRETIRKHIDLWGALRLSNGPGDLSFGGGVPSVPGGGIAELASDGFEPSSPEEKNLLPVLVQGESPMPEPVFEGQGRGLTFDTVGYSGIWPERIVVPTTPSRWQEAEPVRVKLFGAGPLYPALLRASGAELCPCCWDRAAAQLSSPRFEHKLCLSSFGTESSAKQFASPLELKQIGSTTSYYKILDNLSLRQVCLASRSNMDLTGSTTSYYSVCVEHLQEFFVGTTKRQLSFYAETDVELFLSLLDPGSKTRSINEAIRNVMQKEAKVDLNDGKRAVYFSDLGEDDQSYVHSYLLHNTLDSDDQAWEIVRETATRNWRENVSRYLALHEAKLGEPLKLKDLHNYFCTDHATQTSQALTGFPMGDRKCVCGEIAMFREARAIPVR